MKKLLLSFSLLLMSGHAVFAVGRQNQVASGVVVHSQQRSANSNMVSINKGTARDLSRLKGLGLKRAKAIVAYRHAHGEFAHLDDLIKVKGIGRGLLKRVEKNNMGVYRLN